MRPLKVGVQLPEVEREVRWPELLDMIRAIEDLGFDSIWLGEHLLYRWADREPRGPWEAWPSTLAAIAAVTEPGGVRPARRVARASTTLRCSPSRRDDRRDQRRPVRARPRGRLERDRVPRLRLPVRPSGRPLRGGVHDHPRLCSAMGAVRFRGPVLRRPRLRAAAPRAAPGRLPLLIGVQRAADAAAHDGRCGRVEQLVRRLRQPARGYRPPPGDRRCGVPRRRTAPGTRLPAPWRVMIHLPGGTGRIQGDYAKACAGPARRLADSHGRRPARVRRRRHRTRPARSSTRSRPTRSMRSGPS